MRSLYELGHPSSLICNVEGAKVNVAYDRFKRLDALCRRSSPSLSSTYEAHDITDPKNRQVWNGKGYGFLDLF